MHSTFVDGSTQGHQTIINLKHHQIGLKHQSFESDFVCYLGINIGDKI